MLLQQLKERKHESGNSIFQSSENFHFENFSPGPAMVGPVWTLKAKGCPTNFLYILLKLLVALLSYESNSK